VFIPPKERDIDERAQREMSLDERFLPIDAKGVAMSRLHTGELNTHILFRFRALVRIVVVFFKL
jgi:hypothetical protein